MRVTSALRILRCKHYTAALITKAAHKAGAVYLRHVLTEHHQDTAPPNSRLDPHDWCFTCNRPRPCAPVLRARALALLGGHTPPPTLTTPAEDEAPPRQRPQPPTPTSAQPRPHEEHRTPTALATVEPPMTDTSQETTTQEPAPILASAHLSLATSWRRVAKQAAHVATGYATGTVEAHDLALLKAHLTEAVALQRTALPQALGAPTSPLNPRQREILTQLAEGLTTHQIGRVLGISHNTVSSYLQQIYRTIGASNAAHAVRIAMRSGFIT